MGGERSTEIERTAEGRYLLRLTGPLLSVPASDIARHVAELGLAPGNFLIADVAGISDIDITGLVALRQAFDTALARGARVELRLGSHEGTTLAQLCVSMLARAQRGRNG